MTDNQYSPYAPTLTDANQSRNPRAIITINSIPVLWKDIRITTTTFYISDTYHIEIPLDNQPSNFTIGYLATQSAFNIQIFIGFPSDPNSYTTNDLQLFFMGDCDEMIINPLTRTVVFTGRDLTSRLIDTKTYAKYPNQTASNIAISLAEKHNLTPVVTPTSGNVGTLYSNSNVLMIKQTTEWDLLTFLAQQYNYVVYTDLNNLHFEPKPTIQNSKPYVLQYQRPANQYETPIFNGMNLSIIRSLTLTKDVIVKVRVPYSPQSANSFTATSTKSNASISSSKAGKQVYTFTYPGLNRQQAQQQANALLEQISLNEIKINCSLPADNELKKSSLIRLIGTGTRFDQYYYTNMVTRNLNIYDGYIMDIDAKNIDTSSTVSI